MAILPSQLLNPSAAWLAATSQGPFNGSTNVASTAPVTAAQPLAPPPVPFRRRPSLFDSGQQDDPFGYPEDLGGVHDLRPVGSLTPTQQRYLQQVEIDRLGRPAPTGISKFFDYATRLFPFAGAARRLGERAGLHTRRLGQLTDALEANRVATGAYPVGQTEYGINWNQPGRGLGQPPDVSAAYGLPPAPVSGTDHIGGIPSNIYDHYNVDPNVSNAVLDPVLSDDPWYDAYFNIRGDQPVGTTEAIFDPLQDQGLPSLPIDPNYPGLGYPSLGITNVTLPEVSMGGEPLIGFDEAFTSDTAGFNQPFEYEDMFGEGRGI